jgi:hypothetical protein
MHANYDVGSVGPSSKLYDTENLGILMTVVRKVNLDVVSSPYNQQCC